MECNCDNSLPLIEFESLFFMQGGHRLVQYRLNEAEFWTFIVPENGTEGNGLFCVHRMCDIGISTIT
jgi:hypothetical protein